MELDWYPTSGVNVDAVGAATTVSVAPETEEAKPEFVNVTSTEDAPNGVPVAITTETDVAETVVPAVEMVTETCLAPADVTDPIVILNVLNVKSVQVAVMPATVVLHEAAVSCAVAMKLVPVTVMVLPA